MSSQRTTLAYFARYKNFSRVHLEANTSIQIHGSSDWFIKVAEEIHNPKGARETTLLQDIDLCKCTLNQHSSPWVQLWHMQINVHINKEI